MSESWCRIRAACEGQEAVKLLGDKILPRPNPADTSVANQARYEGYLKRAVFYNVSGRTLGGLVGYVFAKEPVVTLPATLKSVEENVDGSGVTLNQQAKAALRQVLSLGRAGLLVDYPTTEKSTSRQDLLDKNIAPTIVLFEAEQITNWRTSVIGAQVFLDLLVLKETVGVPGKDEFEYIGETQYRVLTRTSEGVDGRIFRKEQGKDTYEEDKSKAYQPLDKKGQRLKVIPFTFLGSHNNDPAVDMPPLLDLVNLNLAHFCNSADHEESCFMVGQPTPWLSGLTEQWVTTVLGGTVHLGSRAILPLPEGGSAGLLQADPNTMPFEAMKHKELQMMALGAKLVEQKEVQQTATEASMNHASEVSTLTSCAQNVFLGYKRALEFAGQFVDAETAKITYELSEPLAIQIITPEQASAIMALWMGGAIDFEETRQLLRKSGWAWKDDEEIEENNAAKQFDLTLPKPTPKPAPAKE